MEGTVVKGRTTGKFSAIEKEIIAEIRAIRAAKNSDLHSILLKNQARLASHLIQISHGNVQLRLATLAGELGVEIRTLERMFALEYHRTMLQYQAETRLSYAKWLLSIFPPTKIGAVAALLGYEQVQDFNRFFKKHTRQSPSEWGRSERARLADER